MNRVALDKFCHLDAHSQEMAQLKGLLASTPKMNRDYQDEEDFRTMSRAHEIISDEKRFMGARRHARRQLKTARQVLGKRR